MAKKKSAKTVKASSGNNGTGGIRTAATNRRAFFDYEILERHEAGIVLTGTEIKSVRAGKVDLSGTATPASATGRCGCITLILRPTTQQASSTTTRAGSASCCCTATKSESWRAKWPRRGLTLVALRIYIKGHVAKVELGLARGKRRYDKRQAIINRDMDREARRAVGAVRD